MRQCVRFYGSVSKSQYLHIPKMQRLNVLSRRVFVDGYVIMTFFWEKPCLDILRKGRIHIFTKNFLKTWRKKFLPVQHFRLLPSKFFRDFESADPPPPIPSCNPIPKRKFGVHIRTDRIKYRDTNSIDCIHYCQTSPVHVQCRYTMHARCKVI